jgi:hypothetical protein
MTAISLLATKTLVAAPLLAAPQPGDPGGQGEDFGKSSPVGLLVLILFFIAVGFLVRSMSKHLRKVPASFDEPTDRSDKDSAKDGEESADAADSADAARESAPQGGGSTGRAAEDESSGGGPAEPRSKPSAEANSHGASNRSERD